MMRNLAANRAMQKRHRRSRAGDLRRGHWQGVTAVRSRVQSSQFRSEEGGKALSCPLESITNP
ncbi:hypothetical protein Pla52o_42700 [Novipirellula galeiformis]|uniref:Uncharacterized protein n=1 Tax=Novipirellula galeiformis TaxID=2528004 RepID=A0A5C6C8H8_9BACT|nr:hypothetical protein Pla52o_42700 [Novipirellula galeiformis]